jgi:hypothetical protein
MPPLAPRTVTLVDMKRDEEEKDELIVRRPKVETEAAQVESILSSGWSDSGCFNYASTITESINRWMAAFFMIHKRIRRVFGDGSGR